MNEENYALKDINWTVVEQKVVDYILKSAEIYIEKMLPVSISIKQRAANLAGIFSTVTTATTGAVLASISAGRDDWEMIIGGACTIALFFAGAVQCFRSTSATVIHYPGGQPRAWKDFLENPTSFKIALIEDIENYQTYITNNHTSNEKAAKFLTEGILLALSAPFVGFAGWGITKIVLILLQF